MTHWLKFLTPPAPQIVYVERAPLAPAAVRGALAVADDNLLWRAVQQVITELETETIKTARDLTGEPELCAASVSAGEALDMLRRRLAKLRQEGIKGSNI